MFVISYFIVRASWSWNMVWFGCNRGCNILPSSSLLFKEELRHLFWRHQVTSSEMSRNEMLKTVIPNVLSIYVMHILKLTFIFKPSLKLVKNRVTIDQSDSNQSESPVMYISSSTIRCCAYFNLSRLKLSVNILPISISKRPWWSLDNVHNQNVHI